MAINPTQMPGAASTPAPSADALTDQLDLGMKQYPVLSKALKTEQQAGEKAVEAKVQAESLAAKEQAKAKREQLEKYQERVKTDVSELEKQEQPMPEFKPSQENALELGAIFSMIATVGVGLGGSGKLSGLNALNAMGGMLKGYQSGKKDVFEKEQKIYEKEVARIKAANDNLEKKINRYLQLSATDKEAAYLLGQEIAAENPGVVAANMNAGKADVVQKMAAKNTEILKSILEKSIKTGIAGKGGARSAINERFQNTVLRSGNEIMRSLGLLEQIGIDTGGGPLGGVVGKGTITSELAANLGRELTTDEQKAYNAAAGGMALELAYVLNGGYKPNQGQIDDLRSLYLATPQDSLGSAAYKFADVAAKLKAALEVAPDYTPEQKLYKQQILAKLDKYAPPEVVYERMYGQPMREEPTVRKDERPTPTQKDRDWVKAHPEDRQKFINRFGVEP